MNDERRNDVRLEASECNPSKLLATVVVRSSVLSLEVVNLSKGGICLRSRVKVPEIEVGTKAVIQPFPDSRSVLAECTNVRPDRDGAPLHGFKIFYSYLSDEYVGNLEGACSDD